MIEENKICSVKDCTICEGRSSKTIEDRYKDLLSPSGVFEHLIDDVTDAVQRRVKTERQAVINELSAFVTEHNNSCLITEGKTCFKCQLEKILASYVEKYHYRF